MLHRVRMFSRRVRARLGSSAVILLYHRVADEPDDPYGLCVSPDRFREHLRAIREAARPVSLGEVVAGIGNGRMASRSVCLTFDDGYVDNLHTAGPILEEYGVPATVFVTTGPGGREHELWWDELEDVFLGSSPLPESLEIVIGGVERHWSLDPDAHHAEDATERRPGWAFEEERPDGPRLRVFREIYDAVQPLDYPEQREVMEALGDWAGRDGGLRPSRRLLNAEGVAELDRLATFEVGAHTSNHLFLPAHGIEVQRQEIAGGKATLESWLGRPVPGFAYPYGAYSSQSVQAAREAGVEHACSCLWGPVTGGTDRLLLPRLELPAVDGNVLTEQLVHFFGSA